MTDNTGEDSIFPVEAAPIQEVFKTLVTQIIAEVKNIIKMTKKTPKAILVVGGMASNPYLRDHIRSTFPKLAFLEPTQGNHEHVIKGMNGLIGGTLLLMI